MEIRLLNSSELTEANYNEIFELADAWWSEISNMPLNKKDVFFLINSLKDTSLFYVIEGKVIAYVGCLIIPHLFNSNYTACSVISLVVDESFKNTRLFYRILKDIDSLANKYGANSITATFFDNVKEKNLMKFSYVKKAKEYIKEL